MQYTVYYKYILIKINKGIKDDNEIFIGSKRRKENIYVFWTAAD